MGRKARYKQKRAAEVYKLHFRAAVGFHKHAPGNRKGTVKPKIGNRSAVAFDV